MSRQTNNPSIDFRLIANNLTMKNPDIKVVYITKRIEKNIKDVLFKNTAIIFKQMYHLSTSKVCIVDGYNIAASVLNHKNHLKIIQIWHSLVSIKKFGYQSLQTDKSKNIAKAFCMHKNYDLIIACSKANVEYLNSAFNYPSSSFEICGLPRVDYLLNQGDINRAKIFNKYPQLANKPIILYAPTFRENAEFDIDNLISHIDTKKYNLIIRLHSNTKIHKNILNGLNDYSEFSVLQLLSVANYVITDYSAVSLEASIVDIPVYLYLNDIDQYKKYPGLNIDLSKELPECVFDDPKQLIEHLENKVYPHNDLKEFTKKYIHYLDNKNTARLTSKILQEMHNV